MFDSMDVGHLRKDRSGSAFLAYGTGDVRIKILGDQDEDVDIDDGDTDTAPYLDSSLASLASLAGVSGGGAGVGTGAKSMAGGTLAPRVAWSAHGSLRNGHASNQNAGSERNRSDAPGMLAFEKFPAYLSKICCTLDLPGPAKVRAGEIFKYFVQCQKHIRKTLPRPEIFAIQLCVVWMAAEQFHHAIDKATSICLVEERFCVCYTNRDQLVGELYKKVKEICNKFTPRPAHVPLAEADPCLIEALAGTVITSGHSSVEQGLGWILVSPVPESANFVTLVMPQSVIYLSDSDDC